MLLLNSNSTQFTNTFNSLKKKKLSIAKWSNASAKLISWIKQA